MQAPWRLLGISLLMAGLLQAVAVQHPPLVPVQDASAHEGETIRMAGVILTPRPNGDHTRFTLAADGHGIAAQAPGTLPAQGTWIEATGHLERWTGRLTLKLTSWTMAKAPDPATPSWDQLSTRPASWAGTAIRLRGDVDDGRLHGPAASVRTGTGPWPEQGSVEADGVLAYEPDCLCHVLHAHTVRPWTPSP